MYIAIQVAFKAFIAQKPNKSLWQTRHSTFSSPNIYLSTGITISTIFMVCNVWAKASIRAAFSPNWALIRAPFSLIWVSLRAPLSLLRASIRAPFSLLWVSIRAWISPLCKSPPSSIFSSYFRWSTERINFDAILIKHG